MMTESAAPRARRSTRIMSMAMLVLSGMLVPVALCLIWLAFVVLDTDRFARTVTPIIEMPSVQTELSAALNAGVQFSITRAQGSSPSIRSLVTEAGGTGVIFPEIERAINDIIASPAFREIWTDVNRLAHVEVKRLLRGERLIPGIDEETLTLTFTDIQDALQIDADSRVGQLLDALPVDAAPYITVLQQPIEVPAADFLIRNASLLAIGVSLLSAVLFGLGLRLSLDRRRALILTGACGVFSLVAALVVRTVLSDTLGDLKGVERGFARDYAEALTSSLESGLWLVAVTGAIVALLAWMWPRFGRADTPRSHR